MGGTHIFTDEHLHEKDGNQNDPDQAKTDFVCRTIPSKRSRICSRSMTSRITLNRLIMQVRPLPSKLNVTQVGEAKDGDKD